MGLWRPCSSPLPASGRAELLRPLELAAIGGFTNSVTPLPFELPLLLTLRAGGGAESGVRVRILVVEDSAPTRDLLRRSLEEGGHRVTTASRISTGLRLATSEAFDALVIDIMLPDGSGLDLCREVRSEGILAPILFLTAKGEVHDRIAGLDAGADDYLRKPFALAELHARIRALGRRRGVSPPARVECGPVRIDFTGRRLERGGEAIPLTAREWAVLEVIVARAGRVVSREEVLELAWPDARLAASDSLDVIVSRLRRKLGQTGEGGWIRTVRGQGYVFEPSE